MPSLPRHALSSLVVLSVALAGACGGGGATGSGGNTTSSGQGGAMSSGSTANSTSGAGGNTTSSTSTGTGAGGAGPDLCAGLVQDLTDRPMTALAKPALGQTVVDAEMGTTIRRITAVTPGGANPVIKPAYSTIAAWNADETRLILYDVSNGEHRLYDGKTYQFLKVLNISPPDLEQFYWHTSEPMILQYVHDNVFVRYHVDTDVEEPVFTFDFCSGQVTNGSDPMFSSWDSNRFGLWCDGQVFIFDASAKKVIAKKAINENPAQIGPSGTLAYLSDSGRVTDANLDVVRTLDLIQPDNHASLGRRADGHDTWNGAVYDPGPNGNDDIGILVTWDLTDATSKVIIGPKTGYPYPPDGHISALATKRPGWVVVSTIGDTTGKGLLDLELLLADTNTGKVCRVGRHRSWGKDNTTIAEPYWAEPHAVPSPSGTRILFGSDWGNGGTVDTYVVELPSYKP
jgi:hypothetical protein